MHTAWNVWQAFLKNNLFAAAAVGPAQLDLADRVCSSIETGPNPFEGGPALAWFSDGQVTMVLSDAEAGAAKATGAAVQEYLSYTIEAPLAGPRNQAEALAKTIAPFGTLKGNVGVEMNQLSASLFETLQNALPFACLQPVDGLLEPLRAIKSAPELERIRAVLALCDLAQAETRKLISPGKTEIEVWGSLKAFLEVRASERLPVLADFVAGARTADIGGLPGTYALKAGDAVIAELFRAWAVTGGITPGPISSVSHPPNCAGSSMSSWKHCTQGIQAVKPGLRACDLDALLRGLIRDQGYPVYPHHSGHGIGVSYHEEPRLVPYNTMPLQAGMVVAIEPGIYLPGVGGVRLEDVVLVTGTGCEVLTKHLGNA